MERPTASATLRADQSGPLVHRYVFAQFAEHLGEGIYGGIWVGPESSIPNTRGYRNDVVGALRALNVPLVRWPGGCFGDTYRWRDGIGPRAKRPVRVNTYWETTEPNTFGTHEFLDFAELIGADAYVSVNVGSAPPAEAAEWIEYITSPVGSMADMRARNGRKQPWKLPVVGIGNELWGCGGQMRPEYAADLTRQYGQFLKMPKGVAAEKIASGPNAQDYQYTEVLMREAGTKIDGLGFHYYTIPNRKGARGSATRFDEAEYARTLAKTLLIDEMIVKHSAIMDKYDPQKRVNLAIDEWGILTDVEPGTDPNALFQQNSLRDAILAALNFDIFVRHAERVRLTAIAQMVNVAQAIVFTRGQQMVLTPTYHVYEMYKPFQDAVSLPLALKSSWYNEEQWTIPAVSGSAVRDRSGVIHVALTNVDPNRSANVAVELKGVTPKQVSGRILTAEQGVTAHNDFGAPNVVAPAPFNGATVEGDSLRVSLPPHSIVVLELR